MKGKEDLFSRQQFICVCVFVPPSSVLQISQLCEELRGVESSLSAPISSLRFVPPIHTHTHTHSQICLPRALSLCSPHLISPSLILLPSLLPSFPPSLQRLVPRSQHSSLCLNCEHHNRTNDVRLLCRTSALCPLVLLLGYRPGWRFQGVSFPVRGCGWRVEEDKESERGREKAAKASTRTHTRKPTNRQTSINRGG